MNVSPVNIYNQHLNNCSFEHHHRRDDIYLPYSTKEKAVIACASALGVVASLAVLAKNAGYSLKPTKMFKNFKNSYFSKADFEAKEVISMGVGTCLGGLAGGYAVDRDKTNLKAKLRESIMQIGNISIPITTVALFAKLGSAVGSKKSLKMGKFCKGAASIAGLFTGVYLANYLMNNLSNLIFHNKSKRGVKATDFSAHVDDMVLAATYVDNNKYVHGIGRIVPLALVVPGYEVGIKKGH